jgi:hypothetical protein
MASPSYSALYASLKRILVVNAGDLGGELLKCLALSGFRDICVIDHEHVEQSDLNRTAAACFARTTLASPKPTSPRTLSTAESRVRLLCVERALTETAVDVMYVLLFFVDCNCTWGAAHRRQGNRVQLPRARKIRCVAQMVRCSSRRRCFAGRTGLGFTCASSLSFTSSNL